MGNSRESLLQEFVDWATGHVKGDEKGEAQIFLDRLFRAFGQKGSLDVGGHNPAAMCLCRLHPLNSQLAHG